MSLAKTYPILYSFRRCPYAMRTRMAIVYSQTVVELREILLKAKPQSMLDYSPKGTVPVLVLPEGQVLEESREIMQWALKQNDPQNWYWEKTASQQLEIDKLLDENDFKFKKDLDHYKYAVRFPENSVIDYRQQGEVFLIQLEDRLNAHQYLLDDAISLADIAIFPFVRQFAFVDKQWFENSQYSALRRWLNRWLQSQLFLSTMHKYAPWKLDDQAIRLCAIE